MARSPRRDRPRRPHADGPVASPAAAPAPMSRAMWVADVACIVLLSFWLAQFLGLLIRVLG